MVCPICYEDLVDGNAVCPPCGHLFHQACIEKYVETQLQQGAPIQCPTCCRTFDPDERVPPALPRHLHTFWHPGLRRVFFSTNDAVQRATDDLRARFQDLENRYRDSQEEIERCRVACEGMQAERDRALRDRTQYLDAYVGATIQYRRERERVARRAQAGQPEEHDQPESDGPVQRRRQSDGWFALDRLGALLGFGESSQRIDERTLEVQVALGREQRLQDQLEELNRQMAAKNLELVTKTNEVIAKDEQLAIQNAQLANKERELVDQDGEIAFMVGQLQLKEDQLQEKEAEIALNREEIDNMTRLLAEKEEHIVGLTATIDEMDEGIQYLEGRRARRRSAVTARSTAQASNARSYFLESHRERVMVPLSPPATPRASLEHAAAGLDAAASGRRRGLLADTPGRTPTRAGALPRVYVADNRLPTAPVATIVGPCNANASGQHRWRTTGSNGSVRKFTCTDCQCFVEERKSGGPNSYWTSNEVAAC